MTSTEISLACQELGFKLSPSQTTNLHNYFSLLLQWNKVMNLVGPYSPSDILQTLIIDSLYLAEFIAKLQLQPQYSWDLGAGAGLPGLPLRCLWQEGDYWLVEAREKRALFLSTCLARCQLPNTQVFRGRVEQFMPNQAPANLILSRAFMPWPDLLELVRPYLASQTHLEDHSDLGKDGLKDGLNEQNVLNKHDLGKSYDQSGILILLLPKPLELVPDSWEVLEHFVYPVKKTTQRAFTALRLK